MTLILLEALGAGLLLVFIVWWTMFSGRPLDPPAEPLAPPEPPAVPEATQPSTLATAEAPTPGDAAVPGPASPSCDRAAPAASPTPKQR